MRRHASTILLVALSALSLLACSSSSGGGANADKCTVACAPPATGPCATQDTTQCQDQCVALTEGLAAACVQCIVEHSGWAGVKCEGDCPCDFGPGATTCGGSSGCSCSSADEQCTGFEIAKSTGSDCAAICAAK